MWLIRWYLKASTLVSIFFIREKRKPAVLLSSTVFLFNHTFFQGRFRFDSWRVQKSAKYSLCDKLQGQKQRSIRSRICWFVPREEERQHCCQLSMTAFRNYLRPQPLAPVWLGILQESCVAAPAVAAPSLGWEGGRGPQLGQQKKKNDLLWWKMSDYGLEISLSEVDIGWQSPDLLEWVICHFFLAEQ